MAYTSGVKGTITIPGGAGGQSGFIRRGGIEIAGELFDATTWENQTNHPELIRGLHDLKGDCEAIFDGDATPVLTHMETEDADAIAGFAVYLINATHGYTFAGLISILDIAVEKRGNAAVTMSFESSGAITRVQPA